MAARHMLHKVRAADYVSLTALHWRAQLLAECATVSLTVVIAAMLAHTLRFLGPLAHLVQLHARYVRLVECPQVAPQTAHTAHQVDSIRGTPLTMPQSSAVMIPSGRVVVMTAPAIRAGANVKDTAISMALGLTALSRVACVALLNFVKRVQQDSIQTRLVLLRVWSVQMVVLLRSGPLAAYSAHQVPLMTEAVTCV